jgi:hypothetical protein
MTVDLEIAYVQLRYRLLAWIPPDLGPFAGQRSSSLEILRFGAILYLKSLLPEPPARGIGYKLIAARLKCHILK